MIDVIIPFYRKELDTCRELVKLINKLNDPCVNLILLATKSNPVINEDDIKYVNYNNYAKTIHIMSDEELYLHGQQIGLSKNQIDSNYYHLTTTIFDWIIKKSNFKTSKCFIWLECDMIPIKFNWCQDLFKEFEEKNQPYILGNWWHGNPLSGLAPTMLGVYNWKLRELDYKWEHWGPFDREILYILYKNKLQFVPTTRICKIPQINFWFDIETKNINSMLNLVYNKHICIIDDKNPEILEWMNNA